MVKITDGSVTKEVTKGVFENIYKPLGYSIVIDKEIKKPEVVINKDKEENKDNTSKEVKVEEKEKAEKSFSRSSK